MDFKLQAINYKFFDLIFLSLIGLYIINYFPINLLFTYLVTRSYLVNKNNLLNIFILEFLALFCKLQIYSIRGYNYLVNTENFDKLYRYLSKKFPILENYDPKCLLENLGDKVVDNNAVESSDEDDVIEVPNNEKPKNLKKMFFNEVLKNPDLISNMTKMMGSIDPEVINKMTQSINK